MDGFFESINTLASILGILGFLSAMLPVYKYIKYSEGRHDRVKTEFTKRAIKRLKETGRPSPYLKNTFDVICDEYKAKNDDKLFDSCLKNLIYEIDQDPFFDDHKNIVDSIVSHISIVHRSQCNASDTSTHHIQETATNKNSFLFIVIGTPSLIIVLALSFWHVGDVIEKSYEGMYFIPVILGVVGAIVSMTITYIISKSIAHKE